MKGYFRSDLSANIVKVKITPSQQDIDNYQQFFSGAFKGVSKDMYARILALEADNRKVLIIACELIELSDYLYFRDYLANKYHLNKTDIIIGGTQNHACIVASSMIGKQNDLSKKINAPENKEEINRHVIKEIHERIDAGVEEVFKNLRPARLGWDKGYSYINERYDISSAKRSQKSDQELFNREIFVLRIDEADGKPMGCLLNYCCQGTLMVASENCLINGDLQGEVSEKMEELMGDNFICLYLIGGSGNAKPLLKSRYDVLRKVDGKLKKVKLSLPLDARDILKEALASRQVEDVLPVYQNIKCHMRKTYFRSGEIMEEVDSCDIPFFGNSDPYYREIKDHCVHKLHFLSLGDEMCFATANSITSMELDMKVRQSLPIDTCFVSVEGMSLGYVTEKDSDPEIDGNMHSLVYSSTESEVVYLTGFRKLFDEAK